MVVVADGGTCRPMKLVATIVVMSLLALAANGAPMPSVDGARGDARTSALAQVSLNDNEAAPKSGVCIKGTKEAAEDGASGSMTLSCLNGELCDADIECADTVTVGNSSNSSSATSDDIFPMCLLNGMDMPVQCLGPGKSCQWDGTWDDEQRCKFDSDEGEDAVTLPRLQSALPMYAARDQRTSIVLTFDGIANASQVRPTLRLRGGGYWDEEVECVVTSATNATCDAPPFLIDGKVSMMMQFGRNTQDETPFFPVDDYVLVFATSLNAVSPPVITRRGTLRQVNVSTLGIFQDFARTNGTNLVCEFRRGGETIKLKLGETCTMLGAFKVTMQLPAQPSLGDWFPYISVDGGVSFTRGPAVKVYEPKFAHSRLALSPTAGPVTGGTPLTIDGIYGLFLERGALRVRLTNTYVDSNGTEIAYVVETTAATTDVLTGKEMRFVNKPAIKLQTPPSLVPGYFSLSFSELPGSPRVWTHIPGLAFAYYDFGVAAMAPLAINSRRPADKLRFYAAEIPRTNTFAVRYGEPRTNPMGATHVYVHTLECETIYGATGVPPTVDSSDATGEMEMIECPLPDLGLQPQKGTVLSVAVSLNGVDFDDIPLPTNSLVFYDARVDGMAPTAGPGQGGTTVTVVGSGFVDLPGMSALISTSGGDVAVPVVFEGEGMLSFVMPPSSSDSAQETVDVSLRITSDEASAVRLPQFRYDNTIPTLDALELDAGNRFSERVAVTGSVVMVRITANEDIEKIQVDSFNLGVTEHAAQVVVVPLAMGMMNDDANETETSGPSRKWALRYTVTDGDSGALSFSVQCFNVQGNAMVVSDADPLADKTIEADGSVPKIESIEVKTDRPGDTVHSFVEPGDTLTVHVTADRPLRVLQVTSLGVGGTQLDTEAVVVQAVAGYPSASWKITYLVARSARFEGTLAMTLTAVGLSGNVLSGFNLKPLQVKQPEYRPERI